MFDYISNTKSRHPVDVIVTKFEIKITHFQGAIQKTYLNFCFRIKHISDTYKI